MASLNGKTVTLVSAVLMSVPLVAAAEDELCYFDAFTQGRLGPVDYGTKAAEVATYLDIVSHRAACGMTDERDREYYDAVAAGFGCADSQQFSARFDQITGSNPMPVPDGSKENFSDPAKYDEFCSMVHDLDPADYAGPDGLNDDPYSAQDGLLQKIGIFLGMNANG